MAAALEMLLLEPHSLPNHSRAHPRCYTSHDAAAFASDVELLVSYFIAYDEAGVAHGLPFAAATAATARVAELARLMSRWRTAGIFERIRLGFSLSPPLSRSPALDLCLCPCYRACILYTHPYSGRPRSWPRPSS